MVTVNDILKDDIRKIDGNTILPMFLNDVIDKLGVQSSAAQGLGKVITSSDKLRDAAGHWIYLAKDSSANNGAGDVVGLLKVARKSLYLYDRSDAVRQVRPLCVLDFFVKPEYQRRGIGRALFDHMLQVQPLSPLDFFSRPEYQRRGIGNLLDYMLKDTDSRPTELAIDGPSPLMEAFLAKNYRVTGLLRQSNNYAIAPEFFSEPASSIKQQRSPNATSPRPTPIGRSAAPKPVSVVGDIIHGSDRMCSK